MPSREWLESFAIGMAYPVLMLVLVLVPRWFWHRPRKRETTPAATLEIEKAAFREALDTYARHQEGCIVARVFCDEDGRVLPGSHCACGYWQMRARLDALVEPGVPVTFPCHGCGLGRAGHLVICTKNSQMVTVPNTAAAAGGIPIVPRSWPTAPWRDNDAGHAWLPLSGSQNTGGVYARCAVIGCTRSQADHQPSEAGQERA